MFPRVEFMLEQWLCSNWNNWKFSQELIDWIGVEVGINFIKQLSYDNLVHLVASVICTNVYIMCYRHRVSVGLFECVIIDLEAEYAQFSS